MTQYTDLHIHSYHSDGVLAPAALVEMAATRGLCAIALADHDSVAGIDEALAAGARHGIEVIPAIELSVGFGKFHDIHLLGYFIDHEDSRFRETLALFRARRDERVRAIISRINTRLSAQGKNRITYEEVHDLAKGAIGRPHIAQVLMARRYATDMQDAFERFLLPCNVPKAYFPMDEALEEIRRLRGVSVLAHPTTVTADRSVLQQLVKDLAVKGLNGIEIFNNSCSDEDRCFLERIADSCALLKTGGSDYHGFGSDIEMGCIRGNLVIQYNMIEAMKQYRMSRENVSSKEI
jgi:3',5'-nucleoside bisphosphate phosphatase